MAVPLFLRKLPDPLISTANKSLETYIALLSDFIFKTIKVSVLFFKSEKRACFLVRCRCTGKEFLDTELAKYDSFEEIGHTNKNISMLFEDWNKEKKEYFTRLKNNGVGQELILKFLGGNWKQWMIQEALKSHFLNSSCCCS